MVMKVQKDLFTCKWGQSSQLQGSQEEPKAKKPRRIYYCLQQKDSCQEFSTDSPIYDSYSSDNEEFAANFQEGWPIEECVVKDQQQVFLEKAKVEEMDNVCGCPGQEDISQ